MLDTKEKVLDYLCKGTTYVGKHWIYDHQPSMRYPRVYTTFFGKRMRVHVISFIFFKGAPRNQVNHVRECPYRKCWNPECLYDGTQDENCADVIATGARDYSSITGENHHRAKVTNDQAVYIASTYKPELRNATLLGRKFSITRQAVKAIAKREKRRSK
jgi:hypothetical protein